MVRSDTEEEKDWLRKISEESERGKGKSLKPSVPHNCLSFFFFFFASCDFRLVLFTWIYED